MFSQSKLEFFQFLPDQLDLFTTASFSNSELLQMAIFKICCN